MRKIEEKTDISIDVYTRLSYIDGVRQTKLEPEKAMKFYSVSWMSTKDDNGGCATFKTREQAEQCRKGLIADGCFYVSAVWS